MEVLGYFPISHSHSEIIIIIVIQRTTCRTFPSFATEVEYREREEKKNQSQLARYWDNNGGGWMEDECPIRIEHSAAG